MFFFNRFENIFLWSSGADLEILKQVPTEKSKYFGIGGTIVFTALMASFAGGYAFFTAFKSLSLAIPFGIFWGCLIFNLDRYIVASFGTGDGKKTISKQEIIEALPRLLMAVVLGFVISTPLELKLFEDEIILEITSEKNSIIQKRKDQLNSEFAEIVVYEKKIDNLRDQINKKREAKDKYYDEYICERDGTCGTGRVGRGPEYIEKKQRYEAALFDFQTIEKNNSLIISEVKGKLNILLDEKKKREKEFIKAADENIGLLARLDALSSITAKSSTLLLSKWLITFLFILIEIAPILFKMMTERGPYDDIVDRMKHEIMVRQLEMQSEINQEINSTLKLSERKAILKMDMELEIYKESLNQIAEAQRELSILSVSKWREQEKNNLDEDQKIT